MRQHPISPVTEPMQYRAIGVVRGCYLPAEPDQLTRGLIRTADGTEIEAVVLGRLLTLMRRHLDLAIPHLWVVYPRSREENLLHLQMVGVWEPSTLAAPGGNGGHGGALAAEGEAAPETAEAALRAAAEPETMTAAEVALPEATAVPDAVAPQATAEPEEAVAPADQLPEGDDYFSIRGELIFTRPETGDLVIKVRQQPRPDGSRPVPFKLQLRGDIPLAHLRHFVALDLRRQGQQLAVERFEVIGPVAQRGNRGGRARRGGGDKAGPAKPKGHGRTVSRPGPPR